MYKVLSRENVCVQLAGKLALDGSQFSIDKSVFYIPRLFTCNSNYVSSAPLQFRKLVNVYASILSAEKDYITCGNIEYFMVIRECFHWLT